MSLGQVLLRLFHTSRRFNVENHPKLVLLQKTLLNVEGMGRDLDPSLDLWETAQPYLEKWMRQRLALGGLRKRLEHESQQRAQNLPLLPRLFPARLIRPASQAQPYANARLMPQAQQHPNGLVAVPGAVVAVYN